MVYLRTCLYLKLNDFIFLSIMFEIKGFLCHTWRWWIHIPGHILWQCWLSKACIFCFNRYQRKAAKLTQDFTACANDVYTLFGRYRFWYIDHNLILIINTFSITGSSGDTFFDKNCPSVWNRKTRIWKVICFVYSLIIC